MSVTSIQEARARKALASAVPARAPKPSTLPQPEPITLGALDVRIPALVEITEDEVAHRFTQLCEERLPRRVRSVGEPIAPGDTLTLDVIGFSEGAVLPFSGRDCLEMVCEPQMYFAGFFDALAGARVGAQLQVTLRLGDDYPLSQYREKSAVFGVHILGSTHALPFDFQARGAELPRLLSLGDSIDDVEHHILRALEAERGEALRSSIVAGALATLADRTATQVSEALVDQAVRQVWMIWEGHLLQRVGVTPKDQDGDLQAWLHYAPLRAEMRQTLIHVQALMAVARGEQLDVTANEVGAVAADFGGREALDALAHDTESLGQLYNTLLMAKAADHLVDRSSVTFSQEVASCP